MEENLFDLSAEIVSILAEKGLTVFTAESCTGGLIAKMLTDVPGASRVVNAGIVSYTNDIKNRLLKVRKKTLDAYTAVSQETAAEMAQGARKYGDIGVSVTGYAGGNPSSDPVGLVYIGVSFNGGTSVFRHSFSGDRAGIRQLAATAALHHVKDIISG